MTGSLRDVLGALHQEHGKLTPTIVVTAATDPDSPLHNRFEWDDSTAAHKYRLVQARDLIRSVKVEWVSGPTTEPVRAYHSITRADGCSYEPIEEIAQDPMTTQILLRQAMRDWKALHRRYKHLDEFIRLVREDVA